MAKRHKWKKLGHDYKHTKECVYCGCVKDEKVIGMTFYTLPSDGNTKRYYNAPPCDGIKVNTGEGQSNIPDVIKSVCHDDYNPDTDRDPVYYENGYFRTA